MNRKQLHDRIALEYDLALQESKDKGYTGMCPDILTRRLTDVCCDLSPRIKYGDARSAFAAGWGACTDAPVDVVARATDVMARMHPPGWNPSLAVFSAAMIVPVLVWAA